MIHLSDSQAALIVALSLYFASGFLNLLLARFTPEAIAARAERTHFGHLIAGLLARVGLNIPGVLRTVQRYLAARAQQRITAPEIK